MRSHLVGFSHVPKALWYVPIIMTTLVIQHNFIDHLSMSCKLDDAVLYSVI